MSYHSDQFEIQASAVLPERDEMEIDPNNVDSICEIIDAGEEVYLDAVSVLPPEYYDAASGAVHEHVLRLANEYDGFERLMAKHKKAVSAGGNLSDQDVTTIQSAYDTLRVLRDEATNIALETQSEPKQTHVVVDPTEVNPDAHKTKSNLEAIKQELFARIDRNTTLRPIERAAAHELFRRAQAADATEQEKLFAELEQHIDLVGVAAPDSELIKRDAATHLSDIEIGQGWNEDLVKKASLLHEQITTLTSAPPTESDPVEQLIAQKAWQYDVMELLGDLEQLKKDHENDIPPQVVETVTQPSTKNVHLERGLARRKTLEPEVLDTDDSVPIHVVVPDTTHIKDATVPYNNPQVSETLKEVPNFSEVFEPVAEHFEPAPKLAPAQPIEPNEKPFSEADFASAERMLSQSRKKQVEKIEAKGIDQIDRWLDDVISPYEALAEVPYREVASWSDLSHEELTEQLNQFQVKYRSFDIWVERMAEIESLVPDADRFTFKQVIDRYVDLLQ